MGSKHIRKNSIQNLQIAFQLNSRKKPMSINSAQVIQVTFDSMGLLSDK